MAEGNVSLDVAILTEIKRLLWGDDLKDEVFLRWMQGKPSDDPLL